MISVIVCSKQPPSWDFHRRNVEKTIGADHEYVSIDNSTGAFGICAAYNKGVAQARGDVLVFVHEDCFFMEQGWGKVLSAKFGADEKIGMVGVAGTQYMYGDNPLWIAAGQPFLRGRVVHQAKNGPMFLLTVFSWDKADADVVVVDGLFFAVRQSLFDRIWFDDATFPGFHFYDLDICMQVRRTHRVVVTWDILVKHFSGGNANAEWKASGARFLEKYKDELPVSCVEGKPDPADRKGAQSYDLTGKADKGIVA